jgi:hypothetical protein
LWCWRCVIATGGCRGARPAQRRGASASNESPRLRSSRWPTGPRYRTWFRSRDGGHEILTSADSKIVSSNQFPVLPILLFRTGPRAFAALKADELPLGQARSITCRSRMITQKAAQLNSAEPTRQRRNGERGAQEHLCLRSERPAGRSHRSAARCAWDRAKPAAWPPPTPRNRRHAGINARRRPDAGSSARRKLSAIAKPPLPASR